MKHIELRKIEDARQGTLDYQDVLREVVRRPLDPQRGADIAEMRRSIRLLDALEAADGTLELEDSDYEHLIAKLKAMQWNIIDKRLLELIDDVLGAH